MNKYFFFLTAALTAVFAASFLFSCAGLAERRDVFELPREMPTVSPVPPERPERPDPPVFIMGEGRVSCDTLASFLRLHNSLLDDAFIASFSLYYVEEAATEGVNHDIAFAQMCLETGYLRYGGDVKPEQNNFCGLGATGGGEPGLSFPDPRTGVRAHIQHLKAYGSAESLRNDMVDPRFRFVARGKAPTIQGLTGAWAADPMYSDKIAAVLIRLYDFSF